MLHSGLALAGAQRTIYAWARGDAVPADNDGIVTAEEIAALDLKNTPDRLCSPPATPEEGRRARARAFSDCAEVLFKRAQNLLMTLWKVEINKPLDSSPIFTEPRTKPAMQRWRWRGSSATG